MMSWPAPLPKALLSASSTYAGRGETEKGPEIKEGKTSASKNRCDVWWMCFRRWGGSMDLLIPLHLQYIPYVAGEGWLPGSLHDAPHIAIVVRDLRRLAPSACSEAKPRDSPCPEMSAVDMANAILFVPPNSKCDYVDAIRLGA